VNHLIKRRCLIMGKDRQEKKLATEGTAGRDRDQALHYPGSTKLSSPEEARGLNDGKR
jgi:hypothetical protein